MIPTQTGVYHELTSNGIIVHREHEFSAIVPEAPVLDFCNAEFLYRVDEIRRYSTTTIFVNCMTWLFEQEKRRMAEGTIRRTLLRQP